MTENRNLTPDEFQLLLEKTKHELRAVLAREEVDQDELCDLITRLNALRYLLEQEKEKAS